MLEQCRELPNVCVWAVPVAVRLQREPEYPMEVDDMNMVRARPPPPHTHPHAWPLYALALTWLYPWASMCRTPQCRLTRYHLSKWVHEPFFKQLVPGAWIKVGVGRNPATKLPQYRAYRVRGGVAHSAVRCTATDPAPPPRVCV